MRPSPDKDAAKLIRDYEDLYGEEAFVEMAMNYSKFMREHARVEQQKRDYMRSGLCYGYLRVRAPRVIQKKKSDKKAV